jgi:hypothetical protein
MRTAQNTLIWLCGMLLSGAAVAQPPPEAELVDIPRDPTRSFLLDNSLRAVIIEDHAEPRVSVQLWYRVGASADPPDKPGLTHLVRLARSLQPPAPESPAPTDNPAPPSVEIAGATLSDACYDIRIAPSSELPRLLRDVRQSMSLGALPIDRAALQRALPMTPARDHVQSPAPFDRDELALRAALFGEHAYARPPEAVDPSLRNISDDDIHEHHARWFVTGAAVLVIYGDVDADAATEAVRRTFGDLPWAEPPPLYRDRPPREDRALVRPIACDSFEIALRVPPLATPERDALAVLRELLLNPVDGLWTREGTITLDEWATTDAAVWRLRVHSKISLPVAALGGASLCDLPPAPELFAAKLESVAERIPDPVLLHRARALALSHAAREKWHFADRAAIAGAGFALAHGADLNAQPDVSADAVRQVARALASQLSNSELGPRIATPHASPRAQHATRTPSSPLRHLPALSPDFVRTLSPTGDDSTLDNVPAAAPPTLPAWTARDAGIEFYRHAAPTIARIAIIPPADRASAAHEPPSPPPGELDRLTFHGFFFEGRAADGAAYWCGPAGELPRFLESWPRWTPHTGNSRDERTTLRLRIYADESVERPLREWLTQSNSASPSNTESR